ncbi:MAG: hypothetical protein KIS81_09855 [Maricaulaceae bacterium]|nr:hypothetical protein [Maricaulaceae bacterium]
MTRITRAALLAAASAFVIAPAAQAQQYGYAAQPQAQGYYSQAECERARQANQTAGVLIGALAGAVVGAQIHNAGRDRNPRYYQTRRGHWRQAPPPPRSSNAGAVIAGGAVGALAGGALGGGDPCPPQHMGHSQAGYGHAPAPYGDQRHYQSGGPAYGHDPYYAQGQQYGHAQQPYRAGELAGGPGYDYDYGQDRDYDPQYGQQQAGYGYQAAAAQCRWSETQRADSYGRISTNPVYVCQGADGIWRQAEYVQGGY